MNRHLLVTDKFNQEKSATGKKVLTRFISRIKTETTRLKLKRELKSLDIPSLPPPPVLSRVRNEYELEMRASIL